MKILIVTQYFHPESFRINDLALDLKTRGHEVTVLTGLPNYPKGHFYTGYSPLGPFNETWNEISVVRVPVFPRGRGRAWELALNYLSFVISALIFGLPRIGGRSPFDHVFVWATSPITVALPAIVAKWCFGGKLSIWIQDLWPESLSAVGMVKNRGILWCVGQLVRLIYHFADSLFAQSRLFEKSLTRWGAPTEKIHFLPNWADPVFENTQPVELRANRPFRILFAGNLGHAQALDTLLETATILKKNNEIEFHVYGTGSRRSWLLSEIHIRGLDQFVLHDPLPVSEMPRIYADHTALYVSLVKDSDVENVLPGKVQSYLASSRPILASGGGELSRVISESKSGLVTPAENPKALAEQILKMSQLTVDELNQFGKNGRDYYLKNYSKSAIVESLLQALNAL